MSVTYPYRHPKFPQILVYQNAVNINGTIYLGDPETQIKLVLGKLHAPRAQVMVNGRLVDRPAADVTPPPADVPGSLDHLRDPTELVFEAGPVRTISNERGLQWPTVRPVIALKPSKKGKKR